MNRSDPGPVTVELLADRPHLLDALASLRWCEWGGHERRQDLERWIEITRGEIGRDGLPVTFVATNADGELLGGVGIIAVEHPELADRGPWVVGMIVHPDHRSRGIGAVMLTELTRWALDAGIDRLRVSTSGRPVEFYSRCGFTPVEVVHVGEIAEPLTILAG